MNAATQILSIAGPIGAIELALGYQTWRPNFRGIGATAGTFDNGGGQTKDLLAVARHALAYARDPADG